MRSTAKRLLCLFAGIVCFGGSSLGMADRIITKRGEIFQGAIVEQTSDAVVFESLAAGHVRIPRSEIDVLEQTPTLAAPESPASPATTANVGNPDELAPQFQLDEEKYLT